MLALRSRGLGSAWTTLHLPFEAEANALLGIPDTVTQAGLIPVAYYTGDDFKPANRRPVEEITYFNGWKCVQLINGPQFRCAHGLRASNGRNPRPRGTVRPVDAIATGACIYVLRAVTHAIWSIGTMCSAPPRATTTTKSAPTRSSPSRPSGSDSVPADMTSPISREQGSPERVGNGHAASATRRRAVRRLDVQRDPGTSVDVNPTEERAERDQIDPDLFDHTRKPLTADGHREAVTAVHRLDQMLRQRLVVAELLGRVGGRGLLLLAPLAAQRRPGRAEIRVLGEVVRFARHTSQYDRARRGSRADRLRPDPDAARPRGDSGPSSAGRPCRSGGSPRRRTA